MANAQLLQWRLFRKLASFFYLSTFTIEIRYWHEKMWNVVMNVRPMTHILLTYPYVCTRIIDCYKREVSLPLSTKGILLKCPHVFNYSLLVDKYTFTLHHQHHVFYYNFTPPPFYFSKLMVMSQGNTWCYIHELTNIKKTVAPLFLSSDF